jgi:conjugative transfer signal peptidase TraF
MTGRSAVLAPTVIAVAAIVTAGSGTAPRFVWNVSRSVPTGLYRVRPARDLAVTTLVVAYPPEPLATWLADGRYLPRGVPLLKPVLALKGQTVCRVGAVIMVDGHERGAAREQDHSGRPLPVWQGCRVIGNDEVFLMNPDEPASLDGRYFGAIPLAAIAGRAEPLWTSAEDQSWGFAAPPTPVNSLDRAHSDAPPQVKDTARIALYVRDYRGEHMDLTTLVTACALTIDPKIMHALIWHQSGGEPWAFSVSGQRQPQVLRNMEDAVAVARSTQPDDVVIRIGLAGLPGTPRSVTVTMFTPCSNIASAARQIAQFAELCRTSARSKGDPIHCAVAAWHGSWERPDNGFADAVRATVANNDAPDFEMPAGTGIETADIGSLRQSAVRDTAPAPPPSPTPDDYERARQSPLFPVMSRPSDRSPSDHRASDRSAAGEQKSDALSVRLTATQPHSDGLFVPRSAQQSALGSQ